MLVRTLDALRGTEHEVDWGNGISRRLLVARDGWGFTVTETEVLADTRSLLRYDNHWEACLCVGGAGTVESAAGRFEVRPGTLYAPARGEEHLLSSAHGLRLICVFNPALNGSEQHRLSAGRASSY
ncbi:ectoine synthase [Virgisporangium aurantiacum]|uniref:L-ectoine synthase n=1 Tax=Virgisporangium aurantiacum TaxID=175570 RepID=A0A8J4E5M6_9ACTN|nr:ectoine synthase [Virgisporangium aurantiacum]GIJ62248.1 L-ectoine synthase [Virgisporangium aurantiacum]